MVKRALCFFLTFILVLTSIPLQVYARQDNEEIFIDAGSIVPEDASFDLDVHKVNTESNHVNLVSSDYETINYSYNSENNTVFIVDAPDGSILILGGYCNNQMVFTEVAEEHNGTVTWELPEVEYDLLKVFGLGENYAPVCESGVIDFATFDFTYEVLENGACMITGYTGVQTEVVVPEQIAGMTVEAIGDYAFYGCGWIGSIELPETVSYIGIAAFFECEGLETINIPDGVEEIPISAFQNCCSLKSVEIPDSVTCIDTGAFENCIGLERVVMPDSEMQIVYHAFYNCVSLTSISLSENVWFIHDTAFELCTNLTATVVEDSYAHEWCKKHNFEYEVVAPADGDLSKFTYDIVNNEYAVITGYFGTRKDVSIPACAEGMEVREIGRNAFRNKAITSVVFPETLTTLQMNAFYGCNFLTNIELPCSVKSIGYGAFSECTNLNSVTIPDGLEIIDPYAFMNTSISEIELPDSLTKIGQNAFEGCTKLVEISIPESITTIDHLFVNCISLKKVELPKNLTTITYMAFYNCSSLEELVIPESTTSINPGAFQNCEKLVLKVKEGSNAHQWCVLNEVRFELIEEGLLEYLLWSATGIHAEIIGFKGEPVDLVIPEYIGSFQVLSIDDEAFSGCSSLVSIEIPDSVTYIGQCAFKDCVNLERAIIPDSVEYIGGLVFSGCSNLVSVTLPAGLESIGNAAFSGCSSMTHIDIPASVTKIEDGAFGGCTSLESIEIPSGVTYIGSGAFGGCNNLKGLVIPDGVTRIGDGAFGGCSSLTSIKVPDSVTSMGNSVFSGCKNLIDVVLSDNAPVIGSYAFNWCSALESITIPTGVTEIGIGAFSDCSNLVNISIPDSVAIIGKEAFRLCTSLTDVTLPDDIASIEDETFWGCESLSSIHIPDGIQSIGNRVFCSCSKLVSITIPDSVTKIGDAAFTNCGLKNVKMPARVDSYGVGVFSGCKELISIDIPIGATEIYEGEFSSCSNLTSVTIPEGVTTIGDRAFSFCSSLKNVRIPDSVGFLGENAFFECSSLTTVLMPDYAEFIGEDAFFNCNKLAYISIPEDIEEIGNKLFWGCTSLKSVTIPDSVVSIGDEAFHGCMALDSIILPEGVEEIGKGAFMNTGLKSIALPDDLTYLGPEAFNGCYELTSISIPEGITRIEDETFYGCKKLTSVTIPESVESIGKNVFSGWYTETIYGKPGSYAERYAYENGYPFVDITAICLDMTDATLSKTTLVPGDTVIISGIRVKNADYVHFSGNNLHLKEEDLSEAAFDVQVDNLEDWQTLDDITMVLSAETAVEGRFYVSVQAFDDEEDSSYLDRSTLSYTVSFSETDLPLLDMSSAGLDKQIYAPGDTVTISGIRVKNADHVHISGNNLHLKEEDSGSASFDVSVDYSDEWQTLDDITMVLSAETAVEGRFYISVQACDIDENESPIDRTTLTYNVAVATEGETLTWKASPNSSYSTITVSIASGTPDVATDYLLVAEDADGGHHFGTIKAGKTSATFKITDLQMPRAAKYNLFVLPKDVALTADNRDEFFIGDIVLPLWEGKMIKAVRSGSVDTMKTNKLYVGETIEIDWEGSYGVYNVEVVATLNGQIISGFPKVYSDPALIDRDKPITTTIDSSKLGAAKPGDKLKITVTVTAPNDAANILEAAGYKSCVSDEWEGTVVASRPNVTKAAIVDGNTKYNLSNKLQLVVGDHNYQNGYTLNVELEKEADISWTVYTDNTDIAKAYRKDGLVYIHAKATGTTSLYISDTYVSDETLASLPASAYKYKVCDIKVLSPYNAIVIADPTYRYKTIDGVTYRDICDRDNESTAMYNLFDSMVFDNGASENRFDNIYTIKSYNGSTTTDYLRKTCATLAQTTSEHSVTYIYILCHGGEEGQLAFGLDAALDPKDPDFATLSGRNPVDILTLAQLRNMFDQINGRIVFLLGSCYSGQAIDEVDSTGIKEFFQGIIYEYWDEEGAFRNDDKYYVITAASEYESSISPAGWVYDQASKTYVIDERLSYDIFTIGLCQSISWNYVDSLIPPDSIYSLSLTNVFSSLLAYITKISYEEGYDDLLEHVQVSPSSGSDTVIFEKTR